MDIQLLLFLMFTRGLQGTMVLIHSHMRSCQNELHNVNPFIAAFNWSWDLSFHVEKFWRVLCRWTGPANSTLRWHHGPFEDGDPSCHSCQWCIWSSKGPNLTSLLQMLKPPCAGFVSCLLTCAPLQDVSYQRIKQPLAPAKREDRCWKETMTQVSGLLQEY